MVCTVSKINVAAHIIYFYFRELRKEVSERETSFLMQCEISVISVVLFSAKRFKDFGKANALFLLRVLSKRYKTRARNYY